MLGLFGEDEIMAGFFYGSVGDCSFDCCCCAWCDTDVSGAVYHAVV